MSLGSPAQPQEEEGDQPNHSQRNQAHGDDNEEFHWTDGHGACLQPTSEVS